MDPVSNQVYPQGTSTTFRPPLLLFSSSSYTRTCAHLILGHSMTARGTQTRGVRKRDGRRCSAARSSAATSFYPNTFPFPCPPPSSPSSSSSSSSSSLALSATATSTATVSFACSMCMPDIRGREKARRGTRGGGKERNDAVGRNPSFIPRLFLLLLFLLLPLASAARGGGSENNHHRHDNQNAADAADAVADAVADADDDVSHWFDAVRKALSPSGRRIVAPTQARSRSARHRHLNAANLCLGGSIFQDIELDLAEHGYGTKYCSEVSDFFGMLPSALQTQWKQECCIVAPKAGSGQSCGAPTVTTGTCTGGAVKDDAGTCATDTCSAADFGGANTACCKLPPQNAKCSSLSCPATHTYI